MTTIDAKTTQALSRFDLDYSGPGITALSVDGQAATYTRSGGELVITPHSLLFAGQTFSTAVTYSGAPGAGLPLNTPAYSLGWVTYAGGVLVSAEPEGQSAWYPLNETPADKASYTFRITVAKPYSVAANGLQQSVTDNGTTRTFVWGTPNPVAPYLVTLAIGNLSEETDTSSDVLVRNYFDEGYPAAAITGFARIPQMITYYESLFGPYPFEAYGVVGHNLPLNYSLETQTLTVFGNSFTDEAVVAHELAHSWFGDSVTPYHWQDIWLNEGFASFAARMWQEHTLGKSSVSQSLSRLYQALVRSESRAITIGNPGPDNLFSGQVYDRGELTLAALRALLGDDNFFKILRTYAARFYHGNVTTHDFIAVAEEISGQKLDDFFQAWLYQTRMPDIPGLGLFRKDYATN
jgi:aminopeptidase N